MLNVKKATAKKALENAQRDFDHHSNDAKSKKTAAEKRTAET